MSMEAPQQTDGSAYEVPEIVVYGEISEKTLGQVPSFSDTPTRD